MSRGAFGIEQAAAALVLIAGCPGGARPDAGTDVGTVDAAMAADGGPSDVPADAGSGCPDRPYVGLWVWNDDLVATRDAILDVASGAGVTEVYLHADLFYAGGASEAALADWIVAARARCIDVDLLFGDAAWILPPHRAEATSRTAWALAFADAHPSAGPSGIHFDLEPHQLAAWSDVAMRPALVSALVDTLEPLTAMAEAGGLSLSVDMAFFVDEIAVTRGATTRPGSEWVTDAVSRVVVMDYRDSAESMGFGGMISLAAAEVAHAASAGIPVVLAAETNPQSPEYVSFAEEGRAALFSELGLVRAAYPSIEGVAIHDVRGLAALPP